MKKKIFFIIDTDLSAFSCFLWQFIKEQERFEQNVYKNKVILKRIYLVLRTLNDVDIKQHGLFSNTPECDAPF